METREFQEEQNNLEQVEEYIEKRILTLQEKKEELREDISKGRKDMWEEGRHVVSDFDDIVDICQRSEVIVADEKQYVENLKELQKLEKMKENPYFARIDVQDEYGPEESFYIGAVGLKDEKTYEMYVCDWRAPISSLFYGFDVGDAWYEVDGRRMDVTLQRKRQIQIEEGQLQNIYDTDSSMHDAILGKILSENTVNKLRVIVSSIQKEQNTAIRKIDKKAVLIYGPAGSGKTSVGLHRLAYILYHQREQLTAKNIVILSNSNIYHSYVSGILPALCEDEVSHSIFQDILQKGLPRDIRIEGYYQQYKALEGLDGEEVLRERKKFLELKYSKEMLIFIGNYFEEYKFELPDLKYSGHLILSAEDLSRKVARVICGSFKRKYEIVEGTIRKLYEDYFAEHKEEIYKEIEEKVEDYISQQELEVLYIKTKKQVIQNALERLKERNKLDGAAQLLQIMKTYEAQLTQQNGTASGMHAQLQKDMERKHLWYEDALLYLLVRIYMGEVHPLQNVLHVLIDEAQDYSILHLLILKMLYPKSSYTLLADVCQAISPVTTIRSYGEFQWVFGDDLEQLPLFKSYRSSGSINALAFRMMSQFQKEYSETYSYFQREGKKPQYICSRNKYQTIQEKLKVLENYNMVGILTKDESTARRIYEELTKCGEIVQLIDKPYDEMKERIIVLPLVYSKGLEFDAVITYDFMQGDGDDSFAGKMYLACTRALHELYFVEACELPIRWQECREYLEMVQELQ
ncbi:MAG: hypothetical protein IKK33_14005 [Lachnospiraceae bacterium]|nr:hypothetical protein [Lachnospiraceae bacterium]